RVVAFAARRLAQEHRRTLTHRRISIGSGGEIMRRSIGVLLLFVCALSAHAATSNNDDSCDIGLYPAATLLLPYFEVETTSRGIDTFFTITNVTNLPQNTHVTIWTDWGFPVVSFNVFLTGYD